MRSKAVLPCSLLVAALLALPANSFAPSALCSRSSSSSTQLSADRRSFVKNALLTSAAVATTTLLPTDESSAYEKAYPIELGVIDGDKDLQAVRMEKTAQKKKSYKKSMSYATNVNPFTFRGPRDVVTTATWAGALWLLSGSRSNPLVTPLANAIYDPNDEPWLQDRNDGLFASIPLLLYACLAVVFFALGIVLDRIILLVLADGDLAVSLQLAGVSLIAGASLELGRLSAGAKRPTRVESDRTTLLRDEFSEFAQARLSTRSGGSCHRTDVVRAFRRYFGKYRNEELEGDYALTNLEIERLLKEWNRGSNGNRAEMTSTGFYNGVSVNEQADVFVER